MINCTYDPRVQAMVDVLQKKKAYSYPNSEYNFAKNVADVFQKGSKYIHTTLADEVKELRITLSFKADPLFASVIEVIQPAFKLKDTKVLDA